MKLCLILRHPSAWWQAAVRDAGIAAEQSEDEEYEDEEEPDQDEEEW